MSAAGVEVRQEERANGNDAAVEGQSLVVAVEAVAAVL